VLVTVEVTIAAVVAVVALDIVEVGIFTVVVVVVGVDVVVVLLIVVDEEHDAKTSDITIRQLSTIHAIPLFISSSCFIYRFLKKKLNYVFPVTYK